MKDKTTLELLRIACAPKSIAALEAYHELARRAELEERRGRRDAIRASWSDLERERDADRARIAKLEAREDGYVGTIDDLKQSLHRQNDRIAGLERRNRELADQLAASQAEALPWIRGGEGALGGSREVLVVREELGPVVTCARWDAERSTWLDDGTEGYDSQPIEWPSWQVAWRIDPSALLATLPEEPTDG